MNIYTPACLSDAGKDWAGLLILLIVIKTFIIMIIILVNMLILILVLLMTVIMIMILMNMIRLNWVGLRMGRHKE